MMMMNTSQFKTLVILDLETTGLVNDQPKITELAMIAVQISALDQMNAHEELPRVINKFVKFFNPEKAIHPKASELSELNNNMLNNYAPFNYSTINAMESFLNGFPKPLCFIAHNGNIFDFPILLHEIQSALSKTASNEKTYSSLTDIACVDSLAFFRDIYKLLNDTENLEIIKSIETPVPTNHRGYVEIPIKSTQPKLSMKLVQIYEREFNRSSTFQAHRAEDDCSMLLAILKRYLPDWLEWMNLHNKPLNSFGLLPQIPRTPKIFSPKNTVNIKRPLKF